MSSKLASMPSVVSKIGEDAERNCHAGKNALPRVARIAAADINGTKMTLCLHIQVGGTEAQGIKLTP